MKPLPPLPANRYRQFFERPVKIHVCKDGTFTYRREGESVFNGVALPVFSVDTVEEAKDLQILMCFLVDGDHKDLSPGEPWYKVNEVLISGLCVGKTPVLDVDSLDEISLKMERLYFSKIAK